MRKASVIILFFLTCQPAFNLFAAQSPVLLFLSRQDQADTLGYNIVNELPALVSREVIEGRIPVWDSQSKDLLIVLSFFKIVYTSIVDKFMQAKKWLVYALWSRSKKK